MAATHAGTHRYDGGTPERAGSELIIRQAIWAVLTAEALDSDRIISDTVPLRAMSTRSATVSNVNGYRCLL